MARPDVPVSTLPLLVPSMPTKILMVCTFYGINEPSLVFVRRYAVYYPTVQYHIDIILLIGVKASSSLLG